MRPMGACKKTQGEYCAFGKDFPGAIPAPSVKIWGTACQQIVIRFPLFLSDEHLARQLPDDAL